jgi:hypothetical protein
MEIIQLLVATDELRNNCKTWNGIEYGCGFDIYELTAFLYNGIL